MPNYYIYNWIIDAKTAKFFYVTFGAKFPSDKALTEFEKKVGERMGLTFWKLITEDLFRTADINLTTEDRENIDHVFQRFKEHGLANFTLQIMKLTSIRDKGFE